MSSETEEVLNVLSSVHNILIHKKNWSEENSSLKDDTECDPQEASSWSLLGAIEKVLISSNKYPFLTKVVSELEKDYDGVLSQFDEEHEHLNLIELLYTTMGRLAEELKLNMYAPLFPIEDDYDPEGDFCLLFVPKDIDEEMEKSWKEQEDLYNERMRKNAESREFY